MMDPKRQTVRNARQHLELVCAQTSDVTRDLRPNTGARILLMEAVAELHKARRKMEKALEAGGWNDYPATSSR